MEKYELDEIRACFDYLAIEDRGATIYNLLRICIKISMKIRLCNKVSLKKIFHKYFDRFLMIDLLKNSIPKGSNVIIVIIRD